jgi:hypothetical protein
MHKTKNSNNKIIVIVISILFVAALGIPIVLLLLKNKPEDNTKDNSSSNTVNGAFCYDESSCESALYELTAELMAVVGYADSLGWSRFRVTVDEENYIFDENASNSQESRTSIATEDAVKLSLSRLYNRGFTVSQSAGQIDFSVTLRTNQGNGICGTTDKLNVTYDPTSRLISRSDLHYLHLKDTPLIYRLSLDNPLCID